MEKNLTNMPSSPDIYGSSPNATISFHFDWQCNQSRKMQHFISASGRQVHLSGRICYQLWSLCLKLALNSTHNIFLFTDSFPHIVIPNYFQKKGAHKKCPSFPVGYCSPGTYTVHLGTSHWRSLQQTMLRNGSIMFKITIYLFCLYPR